MKHITVFSELNPLTELGLTRYPWAYFALLGTSFARYRMGDCIP